MAPRIRAPGTPRPDAAARKSGLHPRNRHAQGYDFERLLAVCPELGPLLRRVPHGGLSIDFADPVALRLLNRALLADAYGIRGWDIPAGYLCPAVPGRADYLHHLADLLAGSNAGSIPRGPVVRVLDVGVGASAIYPLIGQREYGWSFVGSDLDPGAMRSAARILAANPGLPIELRLQTRANTIFSGVVNAHESFDATLCNPPFHASQAEVREAAGRKWRKLGRAAAGDARSFGGQARELWCPGGLMGFVRRMIDESAMLAARVRWFTVLVASSSELPGVQRALRQAGARDVRVVAMAQGQKQSRFVAWTFLSPAQQAQWGERWRQ
jgi:23S rRNA (adenine1618-N6)-methyltransferase